MKSSPVVVATTKIDIFKQITTDPQQVGNKK